MPDISRFAGEGLFRLFLPEYPSPLLVKVATPLSLGGSSVKELSNFIIDLSADSVSAPLPIPTHLSLRLHPGSRGPALAFTRDITVTITKPLQVDRHITIRHVPANSPRPLP